MSATIRDVARTAGVGLGTVSRVLNNSPLVSAETRQRVLTTIEKLNYVPSPNARRLSLGKTLSIAVIVPFFTRPAEVERLRGIEHTLIETEYDLILYNVETPEQRDAFFRNVPRRERVDGVIIVSLAPRDGDVAPLKKAGVPVVLIDAHHRSLASLNRVVTDDVAGGCTATQHLLNLGHRRIGFIGDVVDNPFNFTSSRDRYLGHCQALEAAGISPRPDYHGQVPHGRVEARQLAARMLTQPDRPTAIFAASDTQALGVMEAAREQGLRVPEDLSVVGYDDIEVAEYLGLTTMRQQLFDSGRRGVELLLAVLANPKAKPMCEVMPAELVVRGTTASPR
ncbi:MAG: LacI family DNA-binding transcriptional regulator [Anaerolineae bacterium]